MNLSTTLQASARKESGDVAPWRTGPSRRPSKNDEICDGFGGGNVISGFEAKPPTELNEIAVGIDESDEMQVNHGFGIRCLGLPLIRTAFVDLTQLLKKT